MLSVDGAMSNVNLGIYSMYFFCKLLTRRIYLRSTEIENVVLNKMNLREKKTTKKHKSAHEIFVAVFFFG